MAKLEARLAELAAAESDSGSEGAEATRAALADVSRKLDRVAANMALAENEAQYKAMAGQFERLRAEQARLEAELKASPDATGRPDPAAEVDAALTAFDRLSELANREEDVSAVTDLFRQVDVKLYLRFRAVTRGRRVLNTLVGGVLTLGSAPPVRVYEGPTDRAYVKKALAASGGVVPPELDPRSRDSGPEVGSSANGQRLTRRCT